MQATPGQSRASPAARHVRARPASCCRPQPDVVTLPETAVDYSVYGESVFIVKPKSKARRRPAELQGGADLRRRPAPRHEARSPSPKASSRGDLVVSAGQVKLHNGSEAVVDRGCGRWKPRRRRRPTDAAPKPERDSRTTEPVIMRFTDIFIRRPVLADRRQPADPAGRGAVALQPAGPPISRCCSNTVITVTTSLSRRLARSDAGLHHPADRPGGRRGRGPRLPDLVLDPGTPARSRPMSS